MESEIIVNNNADIAAIRVHAILGGGTKKDFFDIVEILEHFSIDQIRECYNQRYPNQMMLMSIPQALTYFADADESDDPVSLKGQTWTSVKKQLQQKVKDYLK
jgi:hypothetical protein